MTGAGKLEARIYARATMIVSKYVLCRTCNCASAVCNCVYASFTLTVLKFDLGFLFRLGAEWINNLLNRKPTMHLILMHPPLNRLPIAQHLSRLTPRIRKYQLLLNQILLLQYLIPNPPKLPLNSIILITTTTHQSLIYRIIYTQLWYYIMIKIRWVIWWNWMITWTFLW